MKRYFGASALLIAASLCVAAVQDTFEIKNSLKAGHTSKYRMTGGMGEGDMAVEFGSDMTVKIDAIKPNGDIVTRSSMGNFSLKMGGQDMTSMMPDMTSVVVSTTNARGEVIDRKVEVGQDQDLPRIENAFVFLYPEKPVKAGDTWVRKITENKKLGFPASQATYTLVGAETKNGKKALKVTIDFKELEGANPITGSGTMWLDASTSEMVQFEYTLKNVEMGQGAPPMDMTGKVVLIESKG